MSPQEEIEGLDVSEHGITAYPDFQLAASTRTAAFTTLTGRSGHSTEPSFIKAKVPSA